MKKFLLIGLMSLSLAACDNANNGEAEDVAGTNEISTEAGDSTVTATQFENDQELLREWVMRCREDQGMAQNANCTTAMEVYNRMGLNY